MKKQLDKVCYACYCLEIANHAIGLHVRKEIRLVQALDSGLNVNESP
jgi:hypothetical protein